MQKRKINEGTRPPGEDISSMFFLHSEELTVYFITLLAISRSTDWYVFGRKYSGASCCEVSSQMCAARARNPPAALNWAGLQQR